MLRPYHRALHVIPLQHIPCRLEQRRQRPKVIHAPTNALYKGTAHVVQAFDELKRRGVDFEPILFSGLSNREALALYADADIMVGQLFNPGDGKQPREALAAGTVVVTNLDPRFPACLPGAVPFVHADPTNITDALESTIRDYERRCRLAREGRAYAEQHLEPVAFARQMLAAVERKTPPAIAPTFFRQQFEPEARFVSIFNAWTKHVVDCDWYRTNVPPGERAGLVFPDPAPA
jgi:hypothetical protein